MTTFAVTLGACEIPERSGVGATLVVALSRAGT